MSIAERIRQKLEARLAPTHLAVENESGMHAVPKGAETHFRVVVVSAAFEGLGRVERHKMVYETLAQEMKDGVHALAVVSRTPVEWSQTEAVPASPPCMGGSAADKRAEGERS
ncbi:MAG: BolA family protein [Polyangiaceae bacterium]